MPISKNEMSFFLPLETPKGISREEYLDAVGEYVVTSILDYVGEGASPVKGVKSFKKLNDKYAQAEKMGDRLPNLDLNGDMLQALTYKIVKGGIKVGIFEEEQAVKAYGHCTGFEGHPVLEGVAPARKFIPGKNETLKPDIIRGIDKILEEFLDNG